ncbi:MAG: type II secretion system protein [Phycisphaerales bacterium]|nr:type II secretion system protein [Phycisphaerales bacterium]
MKAPERHHGFTLLELILVMGIVALAAALAAPTLGNFARGRGLTDQARQLLAVVQYCQDQAVSQGKRIG